MRKAKSKRGQKASSREVLLVAIVVLAVVIIILGLASVLNAPTEVQKQTPSTHSLQQAGMVTYPLILVLESIGEGIIPGSFTAEALSQDGTTLCYPLQMFVTRPSALESEFQYEPGDLTYHFVFRGLDGRLNDVLITRCKSGLYGVGWNPELIGIADPITGLPYGNQQPQGNDA